MAFTLDQWKARVFSRVDISGMVTHLTKPSRDTNGLSEFEINKLATENLINILSEQVLNGSTTEKGFIIGKTPAVCFQEAPLFGLIQNIEHERQRRLNHPSERFRYCGVGLAFSKRYVFDSGGRPVVYEESEKAKQILPLSEHWRIVSLNIPLISTGLVDWTHEREWRMPNAFTFERQYAHVLLYDHACWVHFLDQCPPEIYKSIYGITVLKSIVM